MRGFVLAAVTVLMVGSIAPADQFLPYDAIPLSRILDIVERAGISPVNARIQNGHWDVTGVSGDRGFRLHLDLRVGEILSERPALVPNRPPASVFPARTVATELEQSGFGPIREMTWQNGVWVVVGQMGPRPEELEINAATGQILRESY